MLGLILSTIGRSKAVVKTTSHEEDELFSYGSFKPKGRYGNGNQEDGDEFVN